MTLKGIGHTPLFIPCTVYDGVFVCVVVQCSEVDGDNHSPAPIYMRQWNIVVLDRHLVLLVLAALDICVGYMFVCDA